jgi:S1-C subfamily serine protease
VGAGTGMIISSKGLVLTNHHVIAGAEDLSVEVGGDGDTYDAHVVGYSIDDDIALVQIEGVSACRRSTPTTTWSRRTACS